MNSSTCCRLSFAVLLMISVGTPAFGGMVFHAVETVNGSGFGLSTPSINNNGDVVYIQTTPTSRGIYSASQNGAALIASSTSHFANYTSGPGTIPVSGGAPHVNDGGTVAFWGNEGAAPTLDHGIYTASGGNITTVIAGDSPIGVPNNARFTVSPQIANDGTVVFAAYHYGGFDGAGVYQYRSGQTELLASDPVYSGSLVAPAISNTGLIAYQMPAFDRFGSHISDKLYIHSAGNTTLVDTLNTLRYFDSLDVNDSGTIIASIGHEVRIYDGNGFISTVASSSTTFSRFEDVSINNAGDLVFYATLTGQSAGLFRGGNAAIDKIIAVGDLLDGSPVKQLSISTQAINDEGTIAFWARLANGNQGVYMVSVPEPSTLLLASIGLALAYRVAGRRARTYSR